jgi:hypothetical protein
MRRCLKTERAAVSAKARQIETDAAPICYASELIGADMDSERANRWLRNDSPALIV